MRVLVTEDDAITRRVLELFLGPYGKVDTAASGEECLKRFGEAFDAADLYTLVCLDIGLPGQRGIEVLRQIQEFEKDRNVASAVPVIMLTGASDEKQISAAKELGASRYLLKPVIEAELLSHLRDLGVI